MNGGNIFQVVKPAVFAPNLRREGRSGKEEEADKPWKDFEHGQPDPGRDAENHGVPLPRGTDPHQKNGQRRLAESQSPWGKQDKVSDEVRRGEYCDE